MSTNSNGTPCSLNSSPSSSYFSHTVTNYSVLQQYLCYFYFYHNKMLLLHEIQSINECSYPYTNHHYYFIGGGVNGGGKIIKILKGLFDKRHIDLASIFFFFFGFLQCICIFIFNYFTFKLLLLAMKQRPCSLFRHDINSHLIYFQKMYSWWTLPKTRYVFSYS